MDKRKNKAPKEVKQCFGKPECFFMDEEKFDCINCKHKRECAEAIGYDE